MDFCLFVLFLLFAEKENHERLWNETRELCLCHDALIPNQQVMSPLSDRRASSVP